MLSFPYLVKSAYYALVAQLAEHIHGKDKVISSILIEGYVLARATQGFKSAALRLSDQGLTKMRSILVLGVLQRTNGSIQNSMRR